MAVNTKVYIRWSVAPHPLLATASGGFGMSWNPLLPLPVVGEEFDIMVGDSEDAVSVVVERRTAGVVYWPHDGNAEMMAIIWVRWVRRA
jgi:hypothetical protein